MTVALRNITGEPRRHLRPDGPRIEAGQIVHVGGSLAPEQPHSDAYLIVEGETARAYPKSLWSLAAPTVEEKV